MAQDHYTTSFVLLNNQGGGFTGADKLRGATTDQPILADLTGDGDLDLILSAFDATGASVYLGDGQGGFTDPNGSIPARRETEWDSTW